MARDPLPVVVSVPHGGIDLPVEAQTECLLSPRDFALDGDTWSRELYDFGSDVLVLVDTSVPRAVLDMNRAPDDRPPENPDGVVKTVTVQGKQAWRAASGPPPILTDQLIECYHTTYHQQLEQACRKSGAVLGLDCHTMLARGPKDGTARPLVCISNLGDSQGEPVDGFCSAPSELVRNLRDALARALADYEKLNLSDGAAVRINHPFRGGYITQHHGHRGPLPWIQLELNRTLYLPTGCEPAPRPGTEFKEKLGKLSSCVLRALRAIL